MYICLRAHCVAVVNVLCCCCCCCCCTVFCVLFYMLFECFVCVWQIFSRRSHQKRVNLCIQFSTMNEQDSSWKRNWFNFDEWISNKITHSISSAGRGEGNGGVGGGGNRNAGIFRNGFRLLRFAELVAPFFPFAFYFALCERRRWCGVLRCVCSFVRFFLCASSPFFQWCYFLFFYWPFSS